MPDFNRVNPFRFWCQKVLPLVYDDSLSYYELLNKVVDYLNKTIEDVNSVIQLTEDFTVDIEQTVETLTDAFNTLHDFVDNYFDNLDVQDEIDNKLDEMATDGTLSAMVIPVATTMIPGLITQWLNEHITPTSPPVDKTLTVSNAAADAKVVGDEIAGLKEDLSAVTINNMITPSNFRDTAYQQSIVPDVATRSLLVDDYASSANAETFYYTKRGTSDLLSFDTSKKYFVAARITFADEQTAGLMASGLFIELTDNSTRNKVDTGRFYPSMLIGKTAYMSGLLTPTITKGFLRLDFEGMGTSSVNYAFDLDMVFCGEMPNGITAESVKQIWKQESNPIDFISFLSEIASIKYGDTTADLICWGDSLTAGSGSVHITYPAVCASELDGLSVLNCGVGGENCQTIAARQGGNNVIIPAGAVNGTYAILTDIFGNEIAPLLQGNGANSGNAIIVNNEVCSLSYTNNNYVISGYTGESLTVPTLARFSGSDFTSKIVTFWIGTNGGSFPGLSTSVDVRVAWLKSMIAHLKHNQYVIMGLTVGEETTSFYANEENIMKQAFGNKYFPTRKYLIDNGLSIAGITPTAQDTSDIAAGRVPSSLKSDSVHLNDYGYFAVGKMLANKIRSLGYV